MREVTKDLSKYICKLTYEDIPADVLELVKQYIADYFAASFAGYKVNGKFNEAISGLAFCRGGRADSTVLMHAGKLPAEDAAYLNAAFAQGADMDDGNKKAMGHIATHVMSSVFALAETMDVTWEKVLTAVLCGYEVFNRVAGAAQPGIVKRGFHSTGITGPIASAAACAKLMALSEEQIYNAMSLATLQACGLLTITESGQACKPLNAANAARNGVLSVKLAAEGIEAPRNPLESGKGWFHAMSEHYNEAVIYDGLGERFTISESYLKPYASCRHTHYGIECALGIRSQMAERYGICMQEGCGTKADSRALIDPTRIDRILMKTYPTATAVSGKVVIPQSADDAKFSLHYTLATALLHGEFGFAYLSAESVNETVRNVIGKIEVVSDAGLEDPATGFRRCIVNVHMEDGEMFAQSVEVPKGDADNPFTWEDVKAKLLDCTQGVINAEKAEALLETIRGIDGKARFVYPGCWSQEKI